MYFCFQLFERNPQDRLGMPTCQAGPINSHAFFRNIDWEKLEARQISPPFKPKIVSVTSLLSCVFIICWYVSLHSIIKYFLPWSQSSKGWKMTKMTIVVVFSG